MGEARDLHATSLRGDESPAPLGPRVHRPLFLFLGDDAEYRWPRRPAPPSRDGEPPGRDRDARCDNVSPPRRAPGAHGERRARAERPTFAGVFAAVVILLAACAGPNGTAGGAPDVRDDRDSCLWLGRLRAGRRRPRGPRRHRRRPRGVPQVQRHGWADRRVHLGRRGGRRRLELRRRPDRRVQTGDARPVGGLPRDRSVHHRLRLRPAGHRADGGRRGPVDVGAAADDEPAGCRRPPCGAHDR